MTFYDRLKTSVDNGGRADVIYLCEACDTVPHSILVSERERHGLDGCATRWIRNWLDGCTQSVAVDGSMSGWRAVMSGVPQGSVLAPVSFNIFVGNTDSGTECTLSKFVDDIKVSGAADPLEGRDAIQRDLDRLEGWARVKLVKVNKTKRKVLRLDWGNPRYQYRLGDEGIESSPAEKDLRVQVDGKGKHELARCPHSPERRPYPGLHQKKHGQQVEGCDSAPLLHSAETPPGVLHPALESSTQERHAPVGAGPEQGHRHDQRDGTPLL